MEDLPVREEPCVLVQHFAFEVLTASLEEWIMKRSILVVAVLIVMSSGAIALADPMFIVDTGQPLSPPSSGGWVLNVNQSLAVEFTLDQAYTLSDIEGFIGAEVAGTIAITIYNDAGEVPGGELFSSDVSLELADAWQGLSGLNWNMEAGSYWLSFEVRDGDPTMPYGRMLSGAPSPLGNEAYTTHGYIPLNLQGGSEWVAYDGLNIGVRIQGTPVPVPGAVLLGMLGLGVVGLKLRKHA